MTEFDFNTLKRFPDIEADNLYAFDATDQLILNEANVALSRVSSGNDVVIVGDRYGALTLGAASTYGLVGIRVQQDPLVGELALRNNAERLGLGGSYRSVPLNDQTFAGARVVLWQLPKSLDELTETAQLIAAHAEAGVEVFAGGRVKHMTRTMNQILAENFQNVQAGLGWRKSRLLRASVPAHSPSHVEFPRKEFDQDLGLWICSHGATFGGTKVDHGTRFLLEFEAKMNRVATAAIDLGCGNGTVAAYLARARPQLQITASDQSAAAVASSQATAKENGLEGQVNCLRDDALSTLAPASSQLVLLNPPFHIGTTVHAGIALKLFDAAARVLVPGGELWTVYNRHLDYRKQLSQRVGHTVLMGDNSKFCVAKSTVQK